MKKNPQPIPRATISAIFKNGCNLAHYKKISKAANPNGFVALLMIKKKMLYTTVLPPMNSLKIDVGGTRSSGMGQK